LTICVGAFVQILDHRRHTLAELKTQIDAVADILAERIDRTRAERADLDRLLQGELDYMTPAWSRSPGRQILITNVDGMVIAGARHVPVASTNSATIVSAPLEAGTIGRRLLDILGPGQPLTTFGAAAGVLQIALAYGTAACAT